MFPHYLAATAIKLNRRWSLHEWIITSHIKKEYFVVTRYGQADIPREVSGRRLTVSRNQKIFLLSCTYTYKMVNKK